MQRGSFVTAQQILVKPSKGRVAWALLRRPSYWPDLWRRLKLNAGRACLPAPMGQDRKAAERWAASVAIDENGLLARLGLAAAPTLAERHPDLVAEAADVERTAAERLGGGGSADLIFRLCEALEARTAVETGVAYGWSSLAILASVVPRDGRLWSVDMPHPLLGDHDLTGAVVPNRFHASWTLVREPDHSGLRKVLRRAGVVDFIHYDSDKSYEGRAASYRRLWPQLREGGVLMSDDVGDNTAFRDFAAEVDHEPLVVHAPGAGSAGSRYVGLIRKGGFHRAEPCFTGARSTWASAA